MFRKNLFSKSRIKPFLFVGVIFLLLSIYLILNAIYSNSQYKNLIINNYIGILNVVFSENENAVKNIAAIVDQYATNSSTNSFLLNQYTYHSPAEIAECIAVLNKLKSTYQWINNIAIIDRSNKIVVSTAGYYTADAFYNTEYAYEDYPFSYWEKYLNPFSPFQILPPTNVSKPNSKQAIIPIVFNELDNIKIVNLLIVNLDIEKMTADLNTKKLTDGSSFYILNNQSNKIFPEFPESKTLLTSAWRATAMSKDGIASFDFITQKNKRLLTLSYSPSKSVLGYTFIVTIPNEEIYKSILYQMFTMLFMGLMLLFTLMLLTYHNAKKYNMPMENIKILLQNLNKNKSPAINSNEELPMIINQIIDSNTNLEKETLLVMPLLQEKILVDYLNSADYYIDEKTQKYLKETLNSFKHEYFLSAIINLKFTTQFYEMYENEGLKKIRTGIIDIIKSLFSQKYDVFVLPADKDAYYLLINTDDINCKSEITSLLSELTELFAEDNTFISLQIGAGSVCKTIEGLRQTHLEAIDAINEITNFSDIKINIKQDSPKNKFIYTYNDDNSLYTALVIGNSEKAKKIFTEIVEKNIKMGVSRDAVLQLYIQVINCLFKVMRSKNIEYYENDKQDWDVILDILQKTNSEIVDYIWVLIDIASQKPEQYKTKAPIEEIIKYIDEHYTEQIGLEQIADIFHITPKYLSVKIKSHLNITFLEYLSNIRIEKSKELLLDSNKNISEIYESVGFNNRNTYIRAFKTKAGMTPSEFRNQK